MKKILLLVLLLKFVMAQSQTIDTLLLYKQALMNVVIENLNGSSGEILPELLLQINYKNYDLKFKINQSPKYKNIIFITLFNEFRKDSIEYSLYGKTLYHEILYNRNFTLAYHVGTKKYYKLSGYRYLDICQFARDFLVERNFTNKNTLLNSYKIPYVDMLCFYEIIKYCRSSLYRKCVNCPDNVIIMNF